MKIKPCPFCGSTSPDVEHYATALIAWVECDKCGAEGPSFAPSKVDDVSKALSVAADGSVEAWNRRSVIGTIVEALRRIKLQCEAAVYDRDVRGMGELAGVREDLIIDDIDEILTIMELPR